MLIDCEGCALRDVACRDCVVNALLTAGGPAVDVDEGERRALDVLADSGLVPRLRLRLRLLPGCPPGGLPRAAAS